MTTPENRTPYTPGPENRSTAHTSIWPQPTSYTLPGPPRPGEPEFGRRQPGDTELWVGSPPAPKRPRRTMWLIAVAVALVVVGAALGVYLFTRAGGLSEQSAQRACRTAFENEWKTRVALTTAGSDAGIVVSLQGIDTQETWKTDAGYGVNAVVNYSLTTGIIDPVNDTVAMSCAATGTDDNVSTIITNRG